MRDGGDLDLRERWLQDPAVNIVWRAAIYGPRWSPDSQNIALTAAQKGMKEDIYVVSVKGVSIRSGREEIWKMPSSGGEAVQITRNSSDRPEPAIIGAIRLSRNRIAYYPLFPMKSVVEYLAMMPVFPMITGLQANVLIVSSRWIGLRHIALECRRVHELRERVGDLEVRGLDSRQADAV